MVQLTKLRLWGICLCMTVAAAARAEAQNAPPGDVGSDALEEVIVTAERRSEDLQKTATSVSVRNADEMNKQGRLTLGDFLEDIPGVSGVPSLITPTDPYAGISIRGVIPDNYSGPVIPSTAIYTDGVYQGLGGDYDLDHIEVLRGPQGTLYGRSATGGVIAGYSHDPVLGTFGGNFTGVYSSFATRVAQAALNVPLGSEVALRVSGQERDATGYLGLTSTQSDLRAKLLYKPSDSLSILVGAAAQIDHINQGGPNYGLTAPNTLAIESENPVTIAKDRERQYWANINWDLGWATWTYIPSYKYAVYAPDDVYVGPPSGPVGFNPTLTPMDRSVTQEMRLTSDAGSKVKWIVGTFYYNNILSQDNYLQWLASGALAFNNADRRLTQDLGVFGETTLPLQDTLRLTLGLRYDYTYVDHTALSINNLTKNSTLMPLPANCANGPPGPPNPCFGLPEMLVSFPLNDAQGLSTFNNVTYKARLEKDLTPVNMVYATVSSGFLPGDVQIGLLNNAPYKRAFAEETLTAFEIGSKNRFLHDTLQLNGAIFYYDYSGYQSDIEPTPLIPGAAHVTMTAPAQMWGGDLELIYRLTANDSLNLTGGLLDAEFTGNPTFNFSGTTLYFLQAQGFRRFVGIPPATATAAYNHQFPLSNGSNINARVDGQYFSSYNEAAVNNYGIVAPQTFAELAADSRVSGHAIGNLSANWNSPSGKYSVGGFARNFTNDVYKTGVNYNYTVTPAGVGAVPSVGRSYGATVHVSF